MQFSYFTERPYRGLDEDEILKNKAYFAVPNSRFDRERAADDYNYYLDEYCYAEELGYNAVALNEHHGNPFCMSSVMNVEASILARITQRAKIVLIGNPLPVLKHPLRMAEELAEIDHAAAELALERIPIRVSRLPALPNYPTGITRFTAMVVTRPTPSPLHLSR